MVTKRTGLEQQMVFVGIGLAVTLPVFGIFMTEAPIVWPLSTLIYNASLVYGFAILPRKRINLVLFGLVAMAMLILETSFFFSFYLQNAGFNEAFFYHFRPDLIHAGVGEHALLIVLFVGLITAYFLSSFCYFRKAHPSNPKYVYGCLGLFLFGLLISPPANSLVHYFRSNMTVQTAVYENFPELSGKAVKATFKGGDRYNVVLIYLEGIEQRYFDEMVFPDLLPELTQIRDESLVFTRVAQGVGAGWTMGGIVASQCGYPLAGAHNIKGNSFGIYDDFMPGAGCLGDLLQADGYHLTFMGGADQRFAGKGNFLRTHGYAEVIDGIEMLKHLDDAVPVNSWGVYDDTLLELAYQKYLSLGSQPQPFLLTLLTLDTHHPRGHPSPSCIGDGAKDNSMLAAVHCSDTLVSRFIRQVRSSPFSDQTLIVVFSDHLAMRNTASSLLDSSGELPNLTLFVNFPNGRSSVNSHAGIHYDVGPTVLELMGYELWGQMGFGRSLITGPGYLVQKFGEDGWQEHDASLTTIAGNLWENDVSLHGRNISFKVDEISLAIGNSNFDLRAQLAPEIPGPTAFIFDNSTLKLRDIYSFPFEQEVENTTLSRILLQNKDDLAFAIGRAMDLPGFCDYNRIHPFQYCFFLGKPGSTQFIWGQIDGDFTIPSEKIDFLAQTEPDGRAVEHRANILRRLTSPREYSAGISPPVYIAHSGGAIDNQTYTISLEALELNYQRGHRFFEVDFSWTADGELVASSLKRRFHGPENQSIPARGEFMKFVPKNGLNQLNMDEVLAWAREKGDAYIVTDVKERNIEALERIIRARSEFVQHVIPQVYDYTEYQEAEALGYENIILTLYRMRVDPYQLVAFAAREDPFGITMPWKLAQTGLTTMLEPWNIPIYAHTVNDPDLFRELQASGVDGIYTDLIVPH